MFGLIGEKNKLRVYDSFDRANSNVSVGVADTGQVWGIYGADIVYGISSNQLYKVSGADTGGVFSDVGISDFIAFCTLSVFSQLQRIRFRFKDEINTLTAIAAGAYYTIYRNVDGVSTSIATFAQVPQSGDKVKVKAKGSNIKLYVNDIEILSVNENAHIGATRIALNTNNLDARYNDFKVEAL